MLSINTNISSLIAQNSLKDSTNILNQAVERMTTGYKINHAKDNAANYSISTNMQTQIQSYDVAADNVAMGMDLVTTASDIISTMQSHANRLQSLSIQARNGTYGAQSMQAINSEAAAIMAEINRLYSTAEYNNISLFNNRAYEIDPSLPQAGASGFIEEPVATFAMRSGSGDYGDFISNPKTYTDEDIVQMKTITQAISEGSLEAYGEYSISTKDELVALAEYVNAGNDTTDMTFVLGADIDLSSISNWTPIGKYITTKRFKGTFDGNGHIIKNLTINNDTENYQGLFGCTDSGEIKNVSLVNVKIKGKDYVGGLVGFSNSEINNSYVTGNVIGENLVGGLSGSPYSSISNSYTTCSVTGIYSIGGLVGNSSSSISNSYATGNVIGENCVGGLVGSSNSEISNSYATGNVNGTGSSFGGLVGSSNSEISNSYATGNVNGTGSSFGGLVGSSSSGISNSYATGNVNGTGGNFGGLVGTSSSGISNSYATGNVAGDTSIGGLVGCRTEGEFSYIDCYTTGTVTGDSNVGGIIGYANAVSYRPTTLLLDNCSTYSTVSGQSNVSSLFNAITDYTNTTFSLSNVQYIAQDGIDPIVTSTPGYDLSTVLANVSLVEFKNISTNLLVGINGDSSCQIGFDTNFDFDLSVIGSDISSDSALACINDFLTLLSEKSTMLGAIENRLNSALDSIEVNLTNLTSSLSTIRDADIAEVSSTYIQQQILQQAASTLLATANQSPSIALQLI